MTDKHYGQARQRLTLDELLSPGFSTPWDAPLVPSFPFEFRDVEVMSLAWRSDTASIEAVLPPGLEAVSDVVVAHIYRMGDPDRLGPYGESNIMVGCRHLESGTTGGYSPYLFLSSEAGVAHGREVHGQPKKFGHPTIETDGDAWIARIERNGIDVLTGTLAYKANRSDLSELADHFDFANNINLKSIDHIDGRPAIRQLTSRRLGALHIDECWGGFCTVELRPNVQAPLYRLPVLDALRGLWWRGSFSLVEGHILHDYLTE